MNSRLMHQTNTKRLVAILWLFLAGVPRNALAGPETADLAFLSGKVYTGGPTQRRATAVTVRHDRIVYVGTDAGARANIGRSTRVVDLGGRLLLPGFQDSHAHPALVANPDNDLALDGLANLGALRSRIREFAAAHADRPWITGQGWNEAAFLPSGRPSKELLDELVPDRPAFLVNDSGHQAWVNSKALAAAGIGRDTPQPLNGEIVRDSKGDPTGSLQESAMEVVRAVMPRPSAEQRVADLRRALQMMNAVGITAVEDALVRPPDIAAYATLRKRGQLTARVHLCQYFDPTDRDDEAQIRRFVSDRAALESPDLQADCVKVMPDGGYGSHTVALLEPYQDEPRYGLGTLFVEPARLNALVVRLDALGFNVHVHAIGDRSVRTALDAIEAARRANGRHDTRHTLAHLSLIDPADLGRFRQLGVVANMTPLWSRGDPWETVFAPRMFGQYRAAHLYRARSLLEAGAVLVFGSDWPVTSVAPLEGLETAVTHRYPGGRAPDGTEDAVWNAGERISLEQALVAYTSAGAYLVHDETRRGTIESGRLADLVVLDRNLFETPPLEIHLVKIDMTVFGGRIVYER